VKFLTVPTSQVKVKVTLRLTVSQSVSIGVEPHVGLMTRYLLFFDSYGLVSVGRPLWRADGSFVYSAGRRERSLSRVRISWDSRPYFTVSDLRLPFSSPPTTRRVTMEVFDPASTQICPYKNFWEELIVYFPLIGHEAHRKRRTQQLIYCCVCICCCGNVTEPLPSNEREIHKTQNDGSDLWSTPFRWVQVPRYT
jgi:hypothetical protein